jgi:hypothetical protein
MPCRRFPLSNDKDHSLCPCRASYTCRCLCHPPFK